jgi:nucleotidyltransferase/DNA polymerase involved in DNA repair
VQTGKGQKNAERFYGKLSQAQQTQLRWLAQSSGFDAERTYAERLRQQADMLQTLQSIGTAQRNLTTAGQSVRDWLQRSLHTPDEDYAAYLKRRQALNCQAAAQFHNSTTPEQRAHAVKVLQSYEADVRELMRTSP